MTLTQWMKYVNPSLCVSSWKRSRSVSDQSAEIVWCDTSTATLDHWTQRAKTLNQDWIHSAASSKGTGLSFHISALCFDIYERKLSANELALPSRTLSQHRQTHTLKRTVQYISIWLVCGLKRSISAHIKQFISSTSMTLKLQECRFQRFRPTALILARTIPMTHVRCWFEVLK